MSTMTDNSDTAIHKVQRPFIYVDVYYDRQLTLDVGTCQNVHRLGDEYQHLP